MAGWPRRDSGRASSEAAAQLWWERGCESSQKSLSESSGDFELTVLRVGLGNGLVVGSSAGRSAPSEFDELAARRGAHIRTDEPLLLKLVHFFIDRLDREWSTTAAVHASTKLPIDDARSRDWRIRLVEDFDKRILDVAIRDHGTRANDHSTNSNALVVARRLGRSTIAASKSLDLTRLFITDFSELGA